MEIIERAIRAEKTIGPEIMEWLSFRDIPECPEEEITFYSKKKGKLILSDQFILKDSEAIAFTIAMERADISPTKICL